MKPHPRPPIIRKTIKWTGAAVTVLLVGVWVWSWFFTLMWRLPNHTIGLSTGDLWLYTLEGEANLPEGVSITRGPRYLFSVQLGIIFSYSDPFIGTSRTLPVWALGLPCAAIAALAWHLDTLARRRGRVNHCPKCNYDRAGLGGGAGAVCPECGSAGGPA